MHETSSTPSTWGRFYLTCIHGVASAFLTLIILYILGHTIPVHIWYPLLTGTSTLPVHTTEHTILSTQDIVATSTPAVVSIVISADVPVIEQYYDEYRSLGPFGTIRVPVPRTRQVGTETQVIGGGSGFFVTSDGYLVTNRHVVDTDDASYSVVTNDGQTYDATVIAKDDTLDIAVLKINATSSVPYITFGDSDTLRLGDPVIAIGNALAEFPNSVSVGVISGLSRTITAGDTFGNQEILENVIQTDAAINQGNSGGPLLNSYGDVIGMNVAIAANGENIGFALPSNVIHNVIESVQTTGSIQRPYMGIWYLPVTEALAQQYDLPVTHGVWVQPGEDTILPAVEPGSAAAIAGIQEGDIITTIDTYTLDNTRSLARVIREFSVGDTVPVTLWRNGTQHTLMLTFTSAP